MTDQTTEQFYESTLAYSPETSFKLKGGELYEDGKDRNGANWLINVFYTWIYELIMPFIVYAGYWAIIVGNPQWFYKNCIGLNLFPKGMEGYRLYIN